MNEQGGTALKPSDVLPELLQVVGEAAQNGKTIHDLSLADKGRLALLGYVTTDIKNPPYPRRYRPHHGKESRRRMLGKLTANSKTAMQDAPGYQEALEENTLGLTMAEANIVRATNQHDIHLKNPKIKKGKILNGVVTISLTSFSVPDQTASTLLHTFLQGMFGRSPEKHFVNPIPASPDWQTPQDPWDKAWLPPKKLILANGEAILAPDEPERPTPPIVEVTNLNEYKRIVDEAISTLVRQELELIGVVLPEPEETKETLTEWQETHTFFPVIQAWLQAIADTYKKAHQSGFLQADYRDDPAGNVLKPIQREHIIGADFAAILKLLRGGANGLGHAMPDRGGEGLDRLSEDSPATELTLGDSRYNLEQHPDRGQRLPIEAGVDLRRPRPPKPGKPYSGPPVTRPLNVLERAILEIGDTWRDIKNNPRQRLPEIVGGLTGKALGGLADLAITASVLTVKGVIATGMGVKHHQEDLKSWKQQKKASRARLHVIHGELQWLQAQIAAGSKPDLFPGASLPPSPQLKKIKKMTAMMLANLD